MSSNIDKLTNTFCEQLKNLTSILKHNVNVEQNSKDSSSTSSHKQSLVVKTKHKETRKRYHHEVSSSEDSDDNDTPLNSYHNCVQSSTAPAHRDDDKVSILDEKKMKRNLKALQWESDENNTGKDRVDDGDDDFKELAQELSKEEGLGEPVQQIFLKQFGKIPNLMKK